VTEAEARSLSDTALDLAISNELEDQEFARAQLSKYAREWRTSESPTDRETARLHVEIYVEELEVSEVSLRRLKAEQGRRGRR